MYRLGFILVVLLVSCSTERTFVERPIIFDAQRVALTKEYLKNRYQLETDSITIVPRMIVLHHTVIPTFEKTFEAFNSPTLPNWRPDIENVSGLNVSSQFVVDRDGTIYRLMPETYMARHVIGLNHCAIGVENVGGTPEFLLTKAQLKANIKLVHYLANKYDIDYLIGHHEYTAFEGHELWLEVDEGYRTKKTDPGDNFMKKVRKATKRLNFKPVPEIKPH
ncbi:peptidoglycan recognition family protein [Flavobacteriaceae bacterium GF1]